MANERILVVDDEKGVVRSCTRILQRQGFVVSGQTDSQAVPALLHQETFDLLLTDIKMPRLDGLELLKIAKEIDPHLTVVLITGYGTMEDAITAIRLGAQGFLMKPFEPDELVTTVKDSLARRALVRDSLRLQTMLPLLEINQILQVSGGEISLVQRILEVARSAMGGGRLAWLSYPDPASPIDRRRPRRSDLREAALVPEPAPEATLPPSALTQALSSGRPVWLLSDGQLIEESAGQPTIVGAVLPLLVKQEIVGLLTAETDQAKVNVPFGQIDLDLLSVLAGQLAIIIENVQLFQQTEALRSFNEDIIQNMTNGLIAIDQASCITVFNPAAAAMLGYAPDKVLHQPLTEAIEGAAELAHIFQQTLATGQAVAHRELVVAHRDGTPLPLSLSSAPLVNEAGSQPVTGVVGVIEDLSEAKAMEAERRRLDRLAALGEMAAVVAHEIRNPVAGIAAGVDYLTRHAPQGSVEFEGATMIQGEIRRISRILEDILFVARPMQLNRAAENLTEIIDTVIQRCQPQINERRVTVQCQHPAELPLLQLDSQRLEQVFTNLILNATQASRPGDRIELATRLDAPAAPSNGEEAVTVTISDTGSGIPADVRQRIFEPFFTTKSRGTGLGLSVARRIVEEHGGTIEVESEPGQGTSFIIELPVEREGAR